MVLPSLIQLLGRAKFRVEDPTRQEILSISAGSLTWEEAQQEIQRLKEKQTNPI